MLDPSHLATVKKKLAKEINEITSDLDQALGCAKRGIIAYEAGRYAEAKEEIDNGCDLEFGALGDCDALGGLAEILFPDELEVPHA